MSDENKRNAVPVERATIAEDQKNKLAALAAQANEALKGIASITKSDIVNLMIEEHSDELCDRQIEKLRNRNVDEVKYALWIAKRLREARSAGESLTIKELMQESPLVQASNGPRAVRRTRRRKSPDAATDGEPTTPPSEQTL